MQNIEQDDKELLDLFRESSTKDIAFNKIINKYKVRLYWHIRRLVISHEDADDILQNVFIKLWKGLPGFRGDSSLYTWLYRIATNESLTHLQRKKKQSFFEKNEDDYELQNTLAAEPYFDPSRLEWKLQMAIQKLPAKQKIIFNLRYFDDMPYKQISELLNVSEGALKASYHHAAKKIEDYLLNH